MYEEKEKIKEEALTDRVFNEIQHLSGVDQRAFIKDLEDKILQNWNVQIEEIEHNLKSKRGQRDEFKGSHNKEI